MTEIVLMLAACKKKATEGLGCFIAQVTSAFTRWKEWGRG